MIGLFAFRLDVGLDLFACRDDILVRFEIMRDQLSKYKFEKISKESFKNGLRLLFDAILLYNNGSFPSSFQLSVLAMEELSKSYWVEHYYYSSLTNTGFPDKDFEQEWLSMLYFHPRKQSAFFGWGLEFDYSPDFIEFVRKGNLELKKQKSIYVGLDRMKGGIDVNSQVSLPWRVKDKDAREMISLLVDYMKDIFRLFKFQECFFNIPGKDKLLTDALLVQLESWKFKCKLKKQQ